jgi:hypothetical protein
MNWFKVPMLSVVFAPCVALSTPPNSLPPPDDVKASIAMSFDPVSRTFVPRVAIGVGAYPDAEFVVGWSEIGKSAPSIDGDVKSATTQVPLPWWSQTRRMTFTLPDAEALGDIRDVRIVCAVRIKTGPDLTTYFGDLYFAILDEAYAWKPMEFVLKKVIDQPTLDRITTAENAVKRLQELELARREYRKQLRLLGASVPDNQQPHIGPSTGLRLVFKGPPAPPAPPDTRITATIESARVEGPVHQFDALQVWLWIQEDTNATRQCGDAYMLKIVDSFYRHIAISPSIIPVPFEMDVTEFKAEKMKFAANTYVRIFALIQEKSGTPTMLKWRLHFGPLISVPNLAMGATQQQIYTMTMCDPPGPNGPQQ